MQFIRDGGAPVHASPKDIEEKGKLSWCCHVGFESEGDEFLDMIVFIWKST